MSNPKKIQKIDWHFLRSLSILESELQCFHAYRNLWAQDVACGHKTNISRDELERQQVERIESALGNAYVLAKMLGIRWIECESKLNPKSRDEA